MISEIKKRTDTKMKKSVVKNTLAYQFNPNHKGAPYTIDGVNYMNGGQLKQILRVYSLFGRIEKPDRVPYNQGSDIPELHESVKSSKATLVNMYLGDSLDEILANYVATTASTSHSYVFLIDDEIITYIMNIDEFVEFTKAFGAYASDRKVIRYKADSAKMIQWFEARV